MQVDYDSYEVISRDRLPAGMGEQEAERAEEMLTRAMHEPCKICGWNPRGRAEGMAIVEVRGGEVHVGGICRLCATNNVAGLSKERIVDRVLDAADENQALYNRLLTIAEIFLQEGDVSKDLRYATALQVKGYALQGLERGAEAETCLRAAVEAGAPQESFDQQGALQSVSGYADPNAGGRIMFGYLERAKSGEQASENMAMAKAWAAYYMRNGVLQYADVPAELH